MTDRLEQTTDDLSNVVIPILGIAYGDYIHDCRKLQTQYEEESHDQLHTILGDLSSDLENIDVARQYFTTTFMKEELAMFSRSLLYIGILAVSTPLALLTQLISYTTATPPTPTLFALTVLTVVFGLAPLALLIAFVIRIATVTQYIAGITPFEA
ncbi:hypothetical protein [Haladaptatus salinisoli]|uniref:hypothetical protein n=1 Tax=Haladaptatus salinisoli TaxID=2884876 RepID=UPI001D0B6B72|nr:hypothetical protein [Haladaptatus salinisoli]